jgi:exopolysaccharide biosynthesis protein
LKKLFYKIKFKLIKKIKEIFLIFFYKSILILNFLHKIKPFSKKYFIIKKPLRFFFKILKVFLTKYNIFFFKKRFVLFTNNFFKKLFFFLEKFQNFIELTLNKTESLNNTPRKKTEKIKNNHFYKKINFIKNKFYKKINFIKKPNFYKKKTPLFSVLRKNKFFYKSQNIRVR